MSESSSTPSSSTSPPRKRNRPAPPATAVPEAEPPLFSPSSPPTILPQLAEDLDDERYASGSPLPDEMPPLEDPQTTMGSGSSPEFSAADRRNLKQTIRKGLDAVGRMLNRLLADDVEGPAGLYLMDDDDTEGMADPAANVLARRGLLPRNPDLQDAIRGAIALFSYLDRQLSLKRDIRRARASMAPAPEHENAA